MQDAWLKEMKDAPSSILELFMDEGHRFSARNLATAVNMVAESRRFRKDPRLAKLLDACGTRTYQFSSEDLVKTARILAMARLKAPKLFKAIAAEASNRIIAGDFAADDLVKMIWAFAKAGAEAPELFAVVANEASKRIKEFTSRDLVKTVSAFAVAGVAAPQLFESIADEAVKRRAEFKTDELAEMVWAFATAGVDALELFDVIAAEAEAAIAEFATENLVDIARAFKTAGVHAPQLIDAIAAEAATRDGLRMGWRRMLAQMRGRDGKYKVEETLLSPFHHRTQEATEKKKY